MPKTTAAKTKTTAVKSQRLVKGSDEAKARMQKVREAQYAKNNLVYSHTQ